MARTDSSRAVFAQFFLNATVYKRRSAGKKADSNNRAVVGAGGLSLACEDFGRILSNPFPAWTFFFFFLVEISSRTLIPFFLDQDQSTVAQRAKTTMTECFLVMTWNGLFWICFNIVVITYLE